MRSGQALETTLLEVHQHDVRSSIEDINNPVTSPSRNRLAPSTAVPTTAFHRSHATARGGGGRAPQLVQFGARSGGFVAGARHGATLQRQADQAHAERGRDQDEGERHGTESHT